MALTPPPPRRKPRELLGDVLREIFILLPPGDPRDLVRAAAVCRGWRGILSDATFASNYRERHGAPPMLGFLYEELDIPDYPDDEIYWVSHFVSTATFRPLACQDRPYWHVLDSRHGLVLFYTPQMEADFVVCDLVTGNEWKVQADRKFDDIMRWEWEEKDQRLERSRCNAAVFCGCATDPRDHLDCHGGPFRIALVGSVEDGSIARATVYSSETREWSAMIELETPDFIEGADIWHNAVIGNQVYVTCVDSNTVVEYNMDKQKLSVINPPDMNLICCLMGAKDGMLLFVSVDNPRLHLWSMDVGPSRAVEWARHTIIDLGPVLPPDVVSDVCYMSLAGFAEGPSVIFLGTHHGLYTIDLSSRKGEKVHNRLIRKVMPYIGAWSLPTSHKASSAAVGSTRI